jgi:hypothetical protein
MRTTTIYINNYTPNPIAVECVIRGDRFDYEIYQIKSIELVVGDKEGINISRNIMSNKRALALITSQVAAEEDQIIEALKGEDENVQIDEMIYNQR